jgi:S-adenosylmethionine/arginine decarboxylase-like enzyme
MKNLIDLLEKTAYSIESQGLLKEAENLDVVANTLERLSATNYNSIMEKYKKTKAMGLCTAVDLKNCNLKTMQDKEAIRRYVSTLLKLIDMEPVGELQIARFGNDGLMGYSFSQFIMTSLLSGHFIEKTRSIYLDIFSCKEYDPGKVVEFSASYFEGTPENVHVTLRP